jgi:hypothetical protein
MCYKNLLAVSFVCLAFALSGCGKKYDKKCEKVKIERIDAVGYKKDKKFKKDKMSKKDKLYKKDKKCKKDKKKKKDDLVF